MHAILPGLLAVSLAAAPAAKAPEFAVEAVFNAPVKKLGGLAELKGKVVFLEFWATWCAPCVAGIPRTNRLIEKLAGEPVVFLMVTDEPPETIEAWLKKREVKSWVGVDPTGATLKSYKVRGRPDGYLIGKDGALLARIFPDSLTEKDVRDALAGKFEPRPVTFGQDEEGASPSRARQGDVLFEATVSSASGKRSMRWGSESLEVNALPFAVTLAFIWDVDTRQIVADAPPVASFNARVRTPRDRVDEGREVLKLAVQTALGITVKKESRMTDVYLLALSTGPGASRPRPAVDAEKSDFMSSGGGRLLGAVTMAKMAKGLWSDAGRPVVDESGLAGEYEVDLEWEHDSFPALERALATMGLRLVPARREIDYYRVIKNSR